MPFDQHLCQVDLILRHVVVSGFSLHPAGDVKSGPVKSPWAHLHPGLPHFLYFSTRHPSVRTAASRMIRSRALRLRISKAAWLCAGFQQRTPNRTTAPGKMRRPSPAAAVSLGAFRSPNHALSAWQPELPITHVIPPAASPHDHMGFAGIRQCLKH